MVILSKVNNAELTYGKKYRCFGLEIDLNSKKIYSYIRRNNDKTPILIELDKFEVVDVGDFVKWEKRHKSNGARLLIAPNEIINFDWDRYYDGDELLENIFENFFNKYERGLGYLE